MSEKSKQKGPGEKLKNTKISRATAITVVALIASLAVIIGVTVAANRSKKQELPKDSDTRVTDSDTESKETDRRPSDSEEESSVNTEVSRPADTSASAVEDKLPTFSLPVSGALSKKHDPELQVYSNTMNDYRVHIGVDIVTEENAPVYAAADGTVSKIWKDVLMGYCIAVEHTGDCLTVYKNLSETLPTGITEGANVRSGQLLGSVGESAMIEVAEEPHLHFEMTVDELSVDPLEYFSEKALESLSMDASHGE